MLHIATRMFSKLARSSSFARFFPRIHSRDFSVKVTQKAPNFAGTAVVNGQFKKIELCDFVGKYLVLFFYPLDFSFVCPTELIAFSDRMEEFEKIGCNVVGVSTDSHFCHLSWVNMPRKVVFTLFNILFYFMQFHLCPLFVVQAGGLGGLSYPLLADYTKQISRNYDVLLEEQGFALRGLFIIDRNGVIRNMTVNDLPVGRSVDETLRLVKAFQFTDENGEGKGICFSCWHAHTWPLVGSHLETAASFSLLGLGGC